MTTSNPLDPDLTVPALPRRLSRNAAIARCNAPAPRPAALLLLFFSGPLFAGLFSACSAEREVRPALPNIVYLIADDQGFSDYGFMGSQIVETPHLDALAAAGTVFSHGFTTSSVCRPSLRSILTGLDPIQFNHLELQARLDDWQPQPPDILPDLPTLPRALAKLGYRSFVLGKYGETSHQAGGFTHGASRGPGGPTTGAVVDMQEVFDFIDADASQPFFLWFAPMIPHVPHSAPAELVARYEGKDLKHPARQYYASCSWFDQYVGQLLAHLEQRGLREDTLVVFLSDNGWEQVPFVAFTPQAWGLGGTHGKASMYEVGFRTPIVASWPGQLPQGARSDALVSSLDLLPTVLDYVGQEPPSELLGQSLRPLLEGTRHELHDGIFTSMKSLRPAHTEPRSKTPIELRAAKRSTFALQPVRQIAYGLRTPAWSYIHYVDAEIEELYDMRNDPDQRDDLAASRPHLVGKLRRRVEEHRRQLTRPYLAALEAEQDAAPSPAREAYAACLREERPHTWCTLAVSAASKAGGRPARGDLPAQKPDASGGETGARP